MQYIIKPWIWTCGIKVSTASPRVELNSTCNLYHVSLNYLSFLCLLDTLGKHCKSLFGSFPEELGYKNVLNSLVSFVYIGPRKEFLPPPPHSGNSRHSWSEFYL